MTDTVISAENISKYYKLGAFGGKTLKEDFQRWWAKWRGKPDPLLKIGEGQENVEGENLWALRDVSFEVKRGEILGVIGRNGAGKSTLLKIISRITAPTSGEIRIKGRVGSLLEVGTGFHPELTGRENIYLNGSILGMKKKEIDGKFDEIVEFSEMAQFIDTPVKRYSSGMRVRLAFAVAAHLEPEILVVDEVLAVGDLRFQKKCLGKMDSIRGHGRTILFVSHQMPMIVSLCNKCFLLDNGSIISEGNTGRVVKDYYQAGNATPSSFVFNTNQSQPGDDYVRLLSGAVCDSENKEVDEIPLDEPIKIVMRFKVLKSDTLKMVPNCHFYTADGHCAFVSAIEGPQVLEPGEYISECLVPGNFLNSETYYANLAVSSFESGLRVHFHAKSALSFTVKEDMGNREGYGGKVPGIVRPKLKWKNIRVS
jgi:lipopolysaccharide transport system ATP-binding protein